MSETPLYKKVYILCPAYAVTGGPEALHQLGEALTHAGIDVAMVYIKCYTPWYRIKKTYHPNFKIVADGKPDRYADYHINQATHIDFSPQTLVVLPETLTRFSTHFSPCKTAIWWLSVDNYDKPFNNFSNPDLLHFFQSRYAEHFLIQNGAQHIAPLFDFINIPDTQTHSQKIIRNRVCYNPKKGLEITQKIREKLGSQVEFLPLINMSSAELSEALATSKVYIDFGHHPGKDRIPREAALSGSVVITSKFGAAYFEKDLPISENYKFHSTDISGICDAILDAITHYSERTIEFDDYRKEIKNQKEEFYQQARNIVNQK